MFTQHFICPPILRGTPRGNHWQSAGMCYKAQQFTFKSPLSHVLGAWSMFFSKKNTENSEIMKNRKCPALMSFSACCFWAAEHLSIVGQASNLLHQISYKKQRAELARGGTTSRSRGRVRGKPKMAWFQCFNGRHNFNKFKKCGLQGGVRNSIAAQIQFLRDDVCNPGSMSNSYQVCNMCLQLCKKFEHLWNRQKESKVEPGVPSLVMSASMLVSVKLSDNIASCT